MEIENCLSTKLCSWKIIGNSFFEQSVSIEFRCWCMVSELELKWKGNIWSFGNIKKFVLVSFYKWKKKNDNNKYNQKLPHIYVMAKWMAKNYFSS